MWPANTRVCVHCILFGMVWTLKAGNNERVSMRIAHETVATHSARLVTDSPGLGAVTANIQDTPFWKSATLKSRTLGQFSSLSLVWKRLACTTVKGDQAKDLNPLKRLLCLMRMPLRWMERFTFETSCRIPVCPFVWRNKTGPVFRGGSRNGADPSTSNDMGRCTKLKLSWSYLVLGARFGGSTREWEASGHSALQQNMTGAWSLHWNLEACSWPWDKNLATIWEYKNAR